MTLHEQYEKTKAELDRLGKLIEEGKDEWPKEGDKYWYIPGDGMIVDVLWDNDRLDNAIKSFLGVYRTKEEAEAKRDVVMTTMSPTKRWIPEMYQKYWYVRDDANADTTRWDNDGIDHFRLATNNVFRTVEEAKAYATLLTEYGKKIVK